MTDPEPTPEQRRALDALAEALRALPADRRAVFAALHDDELDDMTDPKTFQEVAGADPCLAVVSLEELAETYGVSERSLRRYIQRGELAAKRLGRRYVVTVEAVRAWLKQR